jgi:hypothetical protein
MNEENEELRKLINPDEENQELNAIDQHFKSVRIEQPSLHFTQRVMNNLHRTAAISLSLPSRNKMLMLAGLLVAVGITILLVAGGAFESVTSITVDQNLIPNEKIREQIPSIPFDGKLIFNIVILMNLALAFIILDRAVLKPWFSRRAKVNY